MNHAMVRRLVLKDWYFNRWPIAGFVLGGAAGLLLLRGGSEGLFYAGSILLITVVISIGIHLTMVTVLHERSEQTLAFVMSLPISGREYAAAKMLGNLLLFVLVWVALLAGVIGVIGATSWMPNGLIPFGVVVLMQLLVGYSLLLAVALVTESLNWTIVAIVVGNFVLQGVMYWVSHMPAVAATMRGDAVVWHPPVLALLAAQLAASAGLLAFAFRLQSRKTDFL